MKTPRVPAASPHSRDDARDGYAETVGVVHEAEEDSCVFDLEGAERREIGIVVAVARHGHVEEVDAPAGVRRREVRHLDAEAQVLWFLHVLVTEIRVTKVVSEEHLGRDVRGHTLDHGLEPVERWWHVSHRPREDALGVKYLPADVPLQGQILGPAR